MKIQAIIMKIMLKIFGAKGFSKIMLKSESSETYKIFCEVVYGRNLCQFNMVDEEQLQKLITLLGDGREKTYLDVGCGIGYTTEYIQEKTQSKIRGIDFAKGAIKSAQKRTKSKENLLEFQVGNINELDLINEKFDVVIAIDTMYFVSDLNEAIKSIKNLLKANGSIFIFYSSRASEKMVRPSEETGIGKALLKNNLKFETYNFTENEKVIWEKSLEMAEKLKDEFFKEGNKEIYKGRKAESLKNIKWQNEGLMTRYLYHVKI